MNYLSICDGIGAAHVAWSPLGWNCVGASEIAAFPIEVVKQQRPAIQHLGDMTKHHEWNIERPDLVCGGTPCQSFSVAGLRKGMADPRGNLSLIFLAIVDQFRPDWVVWENVPGVLSSNGGRDFGAFLGGLGQLGYGFAYRVLDAQYFGLAQRRKRVFVVGYLGDWRPAAAVLFEQHSLQGHPAPCRSKGQAAPTLPQQGSGGGGPRGDFHYDGGLVEVANALTDRPDRGGGNSEGQRLISVIAEPTPIRSAGCEQSKGAGIGLEGDPMFTLDTTSSAAIMVPTLVRMREGKEGGGKGPLVSEDQSLTLATSNDQVLTYSGKSDTLHNQGINHASTYEADASSILSTLRKTVGEEALAEWGSRILDTLQAPEVLRSWLHGESIRCASNSFQRWVDDRPLPREESSAAWTLRKVWEEGPDGRSPQGRGLAKQLAWELGENLQKLPYEGAFSASIVQHLRPASERVRLLRQALSAVQEVGRPAHGEAEPTSARLQVRRLTPAECEKLQGFSPGYTAIPWRGKSADLCPDGPRYKALGNSWAVPVVRWIGERIEAVNGILKELNEKAA